MYIGATLHPGPGTALTNEQLWVQAARELDPVSRQYATNLNRRWDAFIEIRVNAHGKLVCEDPLDVSTTATTLTADGSLMIEARLALKNLALNNDLRQLRMQFLRTWGDWQRFDVWSPTLSHISDFPTYRFGLVQLAEDEGACIKSSLE